MLAAIQVLRDKHASAATGRNRSLTMPGWESHRSAFGSKMKMGAQASVQLEKGCSDQSGSDLRVGGIWNVECVAPDGTVRWHDVAKNMCCTAALDNLLNVYFGGSTPLAGTDYTVLSLGLIDNTAFSSLQAGDTLGSHSGWVGGNLLLQHDPSALGSECVDWWFQQYCQREHDQLQHQLQHEVGERVIPGVGRFGCSGARYHLDWPVVRDG